MNSIRKKQKTKKTKANLLLSKEVEKNYIPVTNFTKGFQVIYERYKKTRSLQLPNILTLLEQFRNEKLNSLSEGEVVKEEIGGEMKNIKETLIFPRRFINRNIGNKINPKVKESRLSFLASLSKIESRGLFGLKKENDEATATISRLRKKKAPKKFSLNILYQEHTKKNRELKNKINQNKRVTHSTMSSIANRSIHDRIEILAKDIEVDAIGLKKTYMHNFRNFQNEFNDYKRVQEFINPLIKVDKENNI